MEEILYDTSSLINACKQRKQLEGYTTILNVVEFPKLLELKLTVIYLSKSDYNPSIKLSKDLLRIVKPIPAVDKMIILERIAKGSAVILFASVIVVILEYAYQVSMAHFFHRTILI